MNTLGPLILLGIAFALLLVIRVDFLLVLRRDELTQTAATTPG